MKCKHETLRLYEPQGTIPYDPKLFQVIPDDDEIPNYQCEECGTFLKINVKIEVKNV